MTEQGIDRYGAEYKRTNNDFHVRYLEQDNGVCSVCHGIGAKIEIRYVVRNYESARVKKKICKNLQAHERSLWICPKCIDNFKQKLSVINERNLAQPKPCPYCGGNAIRKQCHFKVGEGENRYKNEHHEDGSLKLRESNTLAGNVAQLLSRCFRSTEPFDDDDEQDEEGEQE